MDGHWIAVVPIEVVFCTLSPATTSRTLRKGVAKSEIANASASAAPRRFYAETDTFRVKWPILYRIVAIPRTDTDNPRPPRNGFKFKETFALLVGGAEGYSLKSAGDHLLTSAESVKESHDSLRMIFYACAGAISGVVFGFWLGYVGQPRCGDSLFQQLLNDLVFWEGVVDEHTATKWWTFYRSPAGVHVTTGNLPLPSVRAVADRPLTPEPLPMKPDLLKTEVQDPSLVGGPIYTLAPLALPLLPLIVEELTEPSRPLSTVFERPSRTLVGVLRLLGEDALAGELQLQVGKSNGFDYSWLRQ